MRFEEPAEPIGEPGKYVHIAEALRQRPGEWALVFEDIHKNYALWMKQAILKGFEPAGAFEATCRNQDQKTGVAGKIYARFVGEGEQ
jgi:hypothetical protein